MIPYSEVIGKQEEWAAAVTNVATINTPFIGWVPVGDRPAQMEYTYQADSYREPARNSHPDGTTVIGGASAGELRVQLKSVAQYSTKSANVSKLTQDFGNNPAISDELGVEIAKQTKELANDMEAHCLSDQDCRVGVTGLTGYMTRGVPHWIQRAAQSTYPVDESQWPSSGQINTTATASLTEDVLLDVFQSIGNRTESNEAVTAFCGPSLRRAFNNFPLFTPNSGSTVNGGAYPRPVRGGAFDRGVTRYVTPFGFEVDLVTSWRNYRLNSSGAAQSGTTYNTHSGLFLHQSKWEFRWGSKPSWVRKAYEGGKYEAFCEAVWQLICWSPAGEGKYAPAS